MRKNRRAGKPWSLCIGRGYGARVRVYERGGALHAAVRDPAKPGRYQRCRLLLPDRVSAEAWAQEQSARMLRGEEVQWPGRATAAGFQPTWANLFAAYAAQRTPQKSGSEQGADVRRMMLWSRVLGTSAHPAHLTPEQWLRMQRNRAAGAIDARGEAVDHPENRHAVLPRVVQADCQWLRQVGRWAADNWRDPNGAPILMRNPVAGLKVPQDGEARRPLVTEERYKKVREAAERVMMTDHVGATERHRSYLPEILDLLWLTGHRVSAVLGLRWDDVLPESEDMPFGGLRWSGLTDKTKFEHSVPMTQGIKRVIERVRRQRPGVGLSYLFPKPTSHLAPISKHRVREWLLRAEKAAGVAKQQGSLFHAYRRGWATARKHHPLVDVALAGGWKRTETLMRHYVQPDNATTLRVLNEPLPVRERHA